MIKYVCLAAFGAFVLADFQAIAAEIPAETFFRNYQYKSAEISPDGKFLAVQTAGKERLGLAIIDLSNDKANWAFTDKSSDVGWYIWVNNNRLILSLYRDGFIRPDMVAVNRDGSNARALVGVSKIDSRFPARFMRLLPNSTNEILVTRPIHHEDDSQLLYPEVERVNVDTGETTLVVKNPGHVIDWVADTSGQVRAAVERSETHLKILYRADARTNWETLSEYEFSPESDIMWPMGFLPDNQTLLVSWAGDGETDALYTFDIHAKKIKDLAFRHAHADIGRLRYSSSGHALLGVTYEAAHPETVWFSKEFQRIQSMVDNVLANKVNSIVDTGADGARALILSQDGHTPGTYYLLDTKNGKLKKLFEVAEWFHADEMSEQKPIEYAARDGLQVHGYLTLPAGSTGKNVPMVVYLHGGPWARDSWGFDPAVQFLANRGYAVLQVNFRGSTGYGKTFFRAGFRQWGLKQQDDITDGVKWAISQGIADPGKIAIFGASYGGYAALAGLIQTSELYRCGISYAGVTDILRTIHTDAPQLAVTKQITDYMVGNAKKDKEQLRDTSPLTHADKISAPVFLAYGYWDTRVPIATAEALASQLKKRGKLYDFMVKKDEGHGYYKESNRIEFWKKVDEFLKANLQ